MFSAISTAMNDFDFGTFGYINITSVDRFREVIFPNTRVFANTRVSAIETSTIIIGGFVFCNNILWLLCVLNHPALLLRGVANKSLIFFLYDV